MKGLVGVLAGIACATFIACAASPRQATAPAPVQNSGAGAPPAPMIPGDPKAQIKYYADQIDEERRQMGLPEAVLPMSTQPAAATPRVAADTQCHPAASESCGSVCKLSDSICDNSDKICKIADDLGNDEWAADKCSTARSTCGDAHKRCCTCS